MKLKLVLQIIGFLAVFFTLFPLILLDHWWVRIFDFWHIQLTIFTFFALLLYFVRFNIRSWKDYAFLGVLAACFIYQLTTIYPYTPFAEYEVKNSEAANTKNTIGLLAANVLQENEKHDLLIDEILRRRPDLIVLTETNERWRQAVSSAINDTYAYKVEVPLDNTYGMLVYSRYELKDPEVMYLASDSVPSIHATLVMPSNEQVKIRAIHPTPPVPQHNPTSTNRDSQMMQVAKMANQSDMPTIITGDFNDVAWSETTRLFQSYGKLLDPRVGRGFYNTFSANSIFMRWPIDHLFVSEEFRMLELLKGNDIGSDHFPFYAQLSLEPEGAASQKKDEPSEKEIRRATKQIEKEQKENGKN